MIMITLEKIRIEFNRFLDKETSLKDFESWLISESWNMHLKDVSHEVQEVVWSLELNFAEYTSGYLNREDLIDRANRLLQVKKRSKFAYSSPSSAQFSSHIFQIVRGFNDRDHFVSSKDINWVSFFIPTAMNTQSLNSTDLSFKYGPIFKLNCAKLLHGSSDFALVLLL